MLNIRLDKIGEDIRIGQAGDACQAARPEGVMAEVEEDLKREVEVIAEARAKGNNVVPIIEYKDIVDGKISEATKAELRRRGVAVVRGVYPRAEAEALERGGSAPIWKRTATPSGARRRRSRTKYFSKLKSDKPQIFGIYWSKPQMAARTHPHSAQPAAS